MYRPLSRREMLQLTAAAPLVLALSGVARAASPKLLAPATTVPGGRKRALLIGVSKYATGASKRWCDLTTEPDVYTLKSVLKGRFGFKESEIFCLTTPAETTHAAIVAAIQTKLVDWAQPGDAIYFHYSGHGASRYTAGGTPYSTLVPHDHRDPGDKAGENHIASDDLLNLFGAVKKKMIPPGAKEPSGSLFLTFDSCHSGKIVRGENKVRGENPDMILPAPQNAKPVTRGDGDTPLPPLDAGKTRGEAAADSLGTGFAALFACRYDQSASEISGVKRFERGAGATVAEKVGDMGRFTYFLAKTLSESTKTTTYQDVFDLVHGAISAAGYNDQTPDLRGDAGHLLFGGAGPERTTTVAAEWQPDPDKPGASRLVLRAGQLLGATVGSTFSLFKVGDDPKAAQPVTTATVKSVALLSALLTPDAATISHGTPYCALETRHIYDGGALRVSVADIHYHPFAPEITARLQAMAQKDVGLLELVTVAAKSDLAVIRSEALAGTTKKTRDENAYDYSKPGFVIERVQEGTVMRVIPDTSATTAILAADAVAEAIQDTARRRVLASILDNAAPVVTKTGGDNTPAAGVGSDGDGIHVVMRLIPCNTKKQTLASGKTRNVFDGYKKSAANERSEYQDDESFLIEVENTGTAPAFLNILDMSPDGTINPIYPPPGLTTVSYNPSIAPGTKRILKVKNEEYVVTMQAPFGNESMKMIATADDVDFSPLLSPQTTRGGGTPRDNQKRAEGTPLGVLFQTVNDGRRAGVSIPEGDDNLCVGSVTLKVRPPKSVPSTP